MKHTVKLTVKDYQEICSLLKLDPVADQQATKILSELLSFNQIKKAMLALEKIIREKCVLLFGAGPSLEESITQLDLSYWARDKVAFVAVDGAAQALLTYCLPIDVLVTDLDGSFGLLQKNPLPKTIKIIHAHGDNIAKLQTLKPLIEKERVIGTTQTKETRKVKNFGGFTDGDRAAYVAANFHAKIIILFGFDFGATVGRFSKPDVTKEPFAASERKLVKFTIAKKLLSALPQLFPEVKIFNATIQGETIPGVPHKTLRELEKLCK